MKIKNHSSRHSPILNVSLDNQLFDKISNHIYNEYDGSIMAMSIVLDISLEEATNISIKATRHKLNNPKP
jgi:hypothetical protein